MKHVTNNYNSWCQEMGFHSHIGDVLTIEATISSPQGYVFGCSSYDSSSWHWCDGQDGYWYNEGLDNQGTDIQITQVKCQLKNNEYPSCVLGKSKYL